MYNDGSSQNVLKNIMEGLQNLDHRGDYLAKEPVREEGSMMFRSGKKVVSKYWLVSSEKWITDGHVAYEREHNLHLSSPPAIHFSSNFFHYTPSLSRTLHSV